MSEQLGLLTVPAEIAPREPHTLRPRYIQLETDLVEVLSRASPSPLTVHLAEMITRLSFWHGTHHSDGEGRLKGRIIDGKHFIHVRNREWADILGWRPKTSWRVLVLGRELGVIETRHDPYTNHLRVNFDRLRQLYLVADTPLPEWVPRELEKVEGTQLSADVHAGIVEAADSRRERGDPPDASAATPDASAATPDASAATPDASAATPDASAAAFKEAEIPTEIPREASPEIPAETPPPPPAATPDANAAAPLAHLVVVVEQMSKKIEELTGFSERLERIEELVQGEAPSQPAAANEATLEEAIRSKWGERAAEEMLDAIQDLGLAFHPSWEPILSEQYSDAGRSPEGAREAFAKLATHTDVTQPLTLLAALRHRLPPEACGVIGKVTSDQPWHLSWADYVVAQWEALMTDPGTKNPPGALDYRLEKVASTYNVTQQIPEIVAKEYHKEVGRYY